MKNGKQKLPKPQAADEFVGLQVDLLGREDGAAGDAQILEDDIIDGVGVVVAEQAAGAARRLVEPDVAEPQPTEAAPFALLNRPGVAVHLEEDQAQRTALDADVVEAHVVDVGRSAVLAAEDRPLR